MKDYEDDLGDEDASPPAFLPNAPAARGLPSDEDQPMHGILKRPSPIHTERRKESRKRPHSPTPSVTFSDLNVIANPRKLRADGGPPPEIAAGFDESGSEGSDEPSGSDSGSGSDESGSPSDFSDEGSPPGSGMMDVSPRGGPPKQGSGGIFSGLFGTDAPAPQPRGAPGGKQSVSEKGPSKPAPVKGSMWSKWGGLNAPVVTPQQKVQMEKERKDRVIKRAKLLAKFERINGTRPPGNKIDYKTSMSTEELETIDERESYSKRSEMMVKILRRVLLFSCWLTEHVAPKMPGSFKLDLEGWSESIYLSIEAYDEYLYEINDEYFAGWKMNPVVGLVVALSSNAIMFSMTKKLLNNPHLPQAMAHLGETLRQKGGQPQQQQPPQPPPPPQSKQQSENADAAPPQQQEEWSGAPAPRMPPNPFASILSSLFGGQSATMGQGQGPDLSLDAHTPMGRGPEPDLNSLFAGISNMMNAAQAAPARTAAMPSPEEPDAVMPRDVRNEYIERKQPPPTVRVPHASEESQPLPVPRSMRGTVSVGPVPIGVTSAGLSPLTDMPQGIAVIQMMRRGEDNEKRRQGLATIEEIKEGEEEEPLEPEKDEFKEIKIPEPPRKRQRTAPAATPGRRVSLSDLE